ncbi:hypothetical protein VPH35_020869 [Triticum aestivum]
MIDRFQGEEMVYHSFDSVEDDPHNYYPPEFLNTLTPNGLPPHMLKLKLIAQSYYSETSTLLMDYATTRSWSYVDFKKIQLTRRLWWDNTLECEFPAQDTIMPL